MSDKVRYGFDVSAAIPKDIQPADLIVNGVEYLPVVRCKDCKFWDSDCIWCDLWGNTQEYDDGYCNYGERKEE